MTDETLKETIRQARRDEATLTDAFLEGRVPEHDVEVAMGSVNILVEMAISRGIMRGPLDAV